MPCASQNAQWCRVAKSDSTWTPAGASDWMSSSSSRPGKSGQNGSGKRSRRNVLGSPVRANSVQYSIIVSDRRCCVGASVTDCGSVNKYWISEACAAPVGDADRRQEILRCVLVVELIGEGPHKTRQRHIGAAC